MNKTTLILICVIAGLLGCLLWLYRNPLVAAVEVHKTDTMTGGITDTLESITARIEAQDNRIKTEVVMIRETVKTKINALPPDDIARGINDELALWRRGDPHPNGMGNSGARILPDRAGRAGRAVGLTGAAVD